MPSASAALIAAQVSDAAPTDTVLVAIVVDDYDRAIRFFVDALGFDLVEDPPAIRLPGRTSRLHA